MTLPPISSVQQKRSCRLVLFVFRILILQPHVFYNALLDTIIAAKRSAVETEANNVISCCQGTTDSHILDHALATLKSLVTSLKAHTYNQSNENSSPSTFITVNAFAPAQK